jgi:O-antigen/teichoic acid export membrane protein
VIPPPEIPPHPEEVVVPRWVQVPVGLALTALLLLCLAGEAAVVFLPSEKDPVLAPLLGTGLVLVSLWALSVCCRLVFGRKVRGGLLSPVALRVVAWFFLLLPIVGLFTGNFVTNTLQSLVQTAADISIFCGLRSLASRRERNYP